MADPYLEHPVGWEVITLEANPKAEYIVRVESGGTPSTTNDDFWDGDIPWLTLKIMVHYLFQAQREISLS